MLPVLKLFKPFWDICKLKLGPQALPAYVSLFFVALVIATIIDSISTSLLMPELTGLHALVIVAIYNVVLLVTIYGLMTLLGYRTRIMQTLTALVGCGLIISLVLLPGIVISTIGSGQEKLFGLILLVDNVWRIAVNAHIFRHAFSVGMLMSMILSVSYLLFGILLADFILPVDVR